jgi:hypothetical protein
MRIPLGGGGAEEQETGRSLVKFYDLL